MNDERDLEKEYGGNQSNQTYNNYESNQLNNDDETDIIEPATKKHYARPPHFPGDRTPVYERRIKLLIILLILSCVLFFIIGFSISSIFFRKNNNSGNPLISHPEAENKSFYSDLPKLVAFLKKYYYKDLNEDEIRGLLVQTITDQADRYTRIEPAGYILDGSNPEGGFGIRIEPISNKSYAGIRVISITKFTRAYFNLVEKNNNAVFPGDIIVGYFSGSNVYEYFPDFLSRTTYPTVSLDSRVMANDKNYHAGIRFNSNNDPVKVIVYNPLSKTKTTREVVMKFNNYYREKPFSLFFKKDYTHSEADANYQMAYLRLNEFNESEIKRVKEDLLKIATTAPALNELIFDLRGNPGGGATQLLELLNYFIKKEDTPTPLYIMHQKDTKIVENSVTKEKKIIATSPKTYEIYTASNANPNPPTYKVTILVNENSASAAEVFSVVMKEHYPNCLVVGNQTFGKDVYQSIFPYESHKIASFKNYNIRVTNGKWGYFPKNSTSFYYITDPGKEIIGSGASLDLKSSLPFAKLPSLYLQKDSVNSENSLLSQLLTTYLKTYKDSTDPLHIAMFNEIKTNIPSFDIPSFLTNTQSFLRVDNYFDEKMEVILKAVLNSLGVSNPSGSFDFDCYKTMFLENFKTVHFSQLQQIDNQWYEVLHPTVTINDPFLHRAIFE